MTPSAWSCAWASFCDTLEEVIDYLNAHGEKVGLVKVRLYRPWSVEDFVAALPATVKKIAVLDRTKEPGSIGEPLYQDVITSLFEAARMASPWSVAVTASAPRDEPPAAAFAVYSELEKDEPKREFTIGIVDDVHQPVPAHGPRRPQHRRPLHHRVQVLGPRRRRHRWRQQELHQDHRRHTDKYVQAYFQYDSKKTGGVTISHLRFGDSPIRSPYYINKANFVACHNPSYIVKGFPMVPRRQAGRHVPGELPVVRRGVSPPTCRPWPSATSPRTTSTST